jgi:hypothetical protein
MKSFQHIFAAPSTVEDIQPSLHGRLYSSPTDTLTASPTSMLVTLVYCLPDDLSREAFTIIQDQVMILVYQYSVIMMMTTVQILNRHCEFNQAYYFFYQYCFYFTDPCSSRPNLSVRQ